MSNTKKELIRNQQPYTTKLTNSLLYLCIYIYIYQDLQSFTMYCKNLTLLTLGLPPMRVCCSSFQLLLSLCTLYCMHVCCVSLQLLLSFLHALFPHGHPSFHFNLLPTSAYTICFVYLAFGLYSNSMRRRVTFVLDTTLQFFILHHV
jgi:hypothetical protein